MENQVLVGIENMIFWSSVNGAENITKFPFGPNILLLGWDEKGKIVVNSWNEWDPLKHVMVGRADGTCIPAPEPALDTKVPETPI